MYAIRSYYATLPNQITSGPRKIYIEPTTDCNLSCRTCMRNTWEEPGGTMTMETFYKVLDGLKAFDSIETVAIWGIGEPLTHPNITEIIAAVKALGLKTELITNAMVMKEELRITSYNVCYTKLLRPGNGRINAIAFHPENENLIYVGAPCGGLWLTTDAGQSWTPLTDKLPINGVSAIAIDPKAPETMYISTGDKDAIRYSGCVGILKSTDGGKTWSTTGLQGTQEYNTLMVHEILIHPDNSNIIYVATNRGLLKSTNAAASFNELTEGNIYDFVITSYSIHYTKLYERLCEKLFKLKCMLLKYSMGRKI